MESVAQERQNALIKYVKIGKFSRQAFQVFKHSDSNENLFIPRIGMTLGQYFTYDTLAKIKGK